MEGNQGILTVHETPKAQHSAAAKSGGQRKFEKEAYPEGVLL